jgi:hypothetical protein
MYEAVKDDADQPDAEGADQAGGKASSDEEVEEADFEVVDDAEPKE